MPAAAVALELPDRQRVQELVGDQEKAARRDGIQVLVPGGRGRGERPRLQGAERRARLHEMHAQRAAEIRRHSEGAQRVHHQSAAAGPELHEQHRIGPAHLRPDVGAPKPDQLSEDLAHLGRGDEVAGGAQGIAGRVIAEPRVLHRLRDGERAGDADPARDEVGEFRHGASAQVAGASRRERPISQRPTMSTGIDSSWPMVRPPSRYPSCWSGWRKNSATMRATA